MNEAKYWKRIAINDREAFFKKITELRKENIALKKQLERYEKVIHNIANIDTMFINPDGTERDWNDKEALKEIESLVKPIWDEHCEKTWEKHRQKAKQSQ